MGGSVNRVTLIGNLGADPDVRTTPSGQMVANLSIATSETFNNREGQRQERVEWHRVQIWGKQAELAQRFLSKGRKVYIEGRIQTRSWDDQQSGQKRYATEIVASQMVFIDSGGSRSGDGEAPSSQGQQSTGFGGGGYGSYGRGQSGQGAGRGASMPPADGSTPPRPPADDPGFFNDDDVPF